HPRVTVGGGPVEVDLLTGGQLPAAECDRRGDHAPVGDEGVVDTQDLVDDRVELAVGGPGAQPGLQLGVVGQVGEDHTGAQGHRAQVPACPVAQDRDDLL